MRISSVGAVKEKEKLPSNPRLDVPWPGTVREVRRKGEQEGVLDPVGSSVNADKD